MKKILLKFSMMISIVAFFVMALSYAEQNYSSLLQNYPKDRNIIGIGEANRSGNSIKDRRIAEVMARLEIAKQIKVNLREETLDVACEGTAGKIFADGLECKNEFVMVIEETVDQVLVGSKIVHHGERDNIVFAIAVLPRLSTGERLNDRMKESMKKSKENLEKAKDGDTKSLEKAQEEYMKALTYMKEKEIIEGVKGRASDAFEELEKELIKFRERQ